MKKLYVNTEKEFNELSEEVKAEYDLIYTAATDHRYSSSLLCYKKPADKSMEELAFDILGYYFGISKQTENYICVYID